MIHSYSKYLSFYRIMRTYEAIECGDILDAITDLTGAICEFYTPDVNPPERLFYILHKSFQNRSFIVCWRNDKRLTPTGFHAITDQLLVSMLLLVIRSVTDVLRAHSRFVNLWGLGFSFTPYTFYKPTIVIMYMYESVTYESVTDY